ncbi:aminopeptidase [Flavobacterium sp.]|uniref:aminopeptidase n=1 Tax=Flavobacterium sp. TaxID=239 RepID=UPI00261E2C89|nr:aminopeptidase [Flavobacterium sp.]
MKNVTYLFLLFSIFSFSQHHSKLVVDVDNEKKTLSVYQELTYFNQSTEVLNSIILNDWNNAYSDRNSPLGKRFSDEFVRSFHLASDRERGATNTLTIIDETKSILTWNRLENQPDLVEIVLKEPILPNQKKTFTLSYILKIPDDKFTRYGFNSQNGMALKNCFLTPAVYENKMFKTYSNLNIDDASNALSDIDLQITTNNNQVVSDLVLDKKENNTYYFSGKNCQYLNLYMEDKTTFMSFKNGDLDIVTNLEDKKVSDINKALIVDKVLTYVEENLGKYPKSKISVSQVDYDLNPFYGLNQLPSFISPFPDEFIYELKFLKTFLNNYLKSTLLLDSRKDNWIFDAIQIHFMMKYIDEHYPDAKMMGSVAKLKLIKGYRLVSLDFNEQYSYFYMLMARKNLDQPLGNPKNTLIKFNEKIASKYRAGLSFRYLSDYIGEETLKKSIREFILTANTNYTNSDKFQTIIQNNTPKKTDWFFNTIINSRAIVDYKFDEVSKTNDSVSFTLKNKTDVTVPIPVYGIKNKQIVFKEWIDNPKTDSTYTFKRYNADKIVLNYKNIVPEYNQRNNWKSLKPFRLSNRPIKFNLMKDLEDPNYNQVLYVPTLEYNYYDGFIPGINFHNKTILDRPFTFDVNPSFSTKTQDISGSFSFVVNQFNRDSNLFLIRYGFSGSTFHYAPDAYYQKVNPFVIFRFREDDLRSNQGKNIVLRQVYVNREPSQFVKNTFEGNYSIFNARFNSSKVEITKAFAYSTDLQLGSQFGKTSASLTFRRLFDNNRQVNLRVYAGLFLYNKSESNYFNFALDRPTDYLFDYNYLGRSESTGLFSQQFIEAEGGFKSKLSNPFSNQWITTLNASFNIWNWVEIYSDFGFLKNKQQDARFVYDNGIRLNLVTDFFELYFPVYSNNGWEVSQPKYTEKIRFIIAFSPKSLVGLFTRKWF